MMHYLGQVVEISHLSSLPLIEKDSKKHWQTNSQLPRLGTGSCFFSEFKLFQEVRLYIVFEAWCKAQTPWTLGNFRPMKRNSLWLSTWESAARTLQPANLTRKHQGSSPPPNAANKKQHQNLGKDQSHRRLPGGSLGSSVLAWEAIFYLFFA